MNATFAINFATTQKSENVSPKPHVCKYLVMTIAKYKTNE